MTTKKGFLRDEEMKDMKNKNYIVNLLLLIYPFVPTLIMVYLNIIQVQVTKTYDFSVIPYYVVIIIFYIVFMLFVYMVFVRRYYPSYTVLFIGLVELVFLQNPSLSYNILGIVQGSSSLYLYGSLMSVYLLALIVKLMERKIGSK